MKYPDSCMLMPDADRRALANAVANKMKWSPLKRGPLKRELTEFRGRPGVYCVRKRRRHQILYVGQTKDLFDRLTNDLWHLDVHTFAREHACQSLKKLGSGAKKDVPRSKTSRSAIEEQLAHSYERELQVAWELVLFGRLELEAALCQELRPVYNAD